MAFVSLALVGATFAVPTAFAEDGRSTWITVLSGASQIEPVDTRARGVAIFQLLDDGATIRFKLIVANIEDVFMAHIHVGNGSTAGGVVVWLYAAAPPSLIEGRFQGILAEATITAASLVGALGGSPWRASPRGWTLRTST